MSLQMMKDPEFAKFMQHQALIDQVLFGDLPIENAPFEVQQEVKEIYKESKEADENFKVREMLGVPFEQELDPWQKDKLFNQAFEWGDRLGKITAKIYENNKDINIFRILNNCALVASKMIGALDYEPWEDEEWQWRLDRIGYTLSLTSLRRCLESLEKLRNNEISNLLKPEQFITKGKTIQQELIDRLDKIEQEKFRKR